MYVSVAVVSLRMAYNASGAVEHLTGSAAASLELRLPKLRVGRVVMFKFMC